MQRPIEILTHASTEAEILSKISTQYFKHSRPRWNMSDRVDVNVSIQLEAVHDVDARQGIITTSPHIALTWSDEILAHLVPSQLADRGMCIPGSFIWAPPIEVLEMGSDILDTSLVTSHEKFPGILGDSVSKISRDIPGI